MHDWPELSPSLAAVYVVPEYRRQGVGASLVNAVVSKARSLRAETIYLLTIEREDFYARLGWTVHDRAGGKTVMSHPIAMEAS